MKEKGKMNRCCLAVLVFLVWSNISFAVNDAKSIRESAYYGRTFEEFYARLDGLPINALVDELGEQIETILMKKGRNIAPVDLEHQIEAAEQQIFNQLQKKLCTDKTGNWSRVRIELSGIESLSTTLSQHKVQNDDYARFTSVLVRIFDNSKGRFCKSNNFRR
jgi:hypothetical protein